MYFYLNSIYLQLNSVYLIWSLYNFDPLELETPSIRIRDISNWIKVMIMISDQIKKMYR